MNKRIRKNLIEIAQQEIHNDPSHDFSHALRVLILAEKISKNEGGDLDIIVPAALFHDIIAYPKNSKQREKSQPHSALKTTLILKKIKFPNEKIKKITSIIKGCSFSKSQNANSLEEKIIHDADLLEATGAISIMRTFASVGSMNRSFYDIKKPFPRKRPIDDKRYGIDLFYTRLLLVKDYLHTKSARLICINRHKFLRLFLKQVEKEITL